VALELLGICCRQLLHCVPVRAGAGAGAEEEEEEEEEEKGSAAAESL